MARQYRLGLLRRLGNLWMSAMVMLRIPRHTVLLETVGGNTGKTRRTPVNVLRLDGERWLVAPYGQVGWVYNLRTAPKALLRRGLVIERIDVEAVAAEVAGPVLKAYTKKFPITRPFFDAPADAPPEVFAAEAARHPVFRVLVTDPNGKRAI